MDELQIKEIKEIIDRAVNDNKEKEMSYETLMEILTDVLLCLQKQMRDIDENVMNSIKILLDLRQKEEDIINILDTVFEVSTSKADLGVLDLIVSEDEED